MRRLNMFGSIETSISQSAGWQEIKLNSSTLKKVIKSTLVSVGIGFVLLIITLVLAAKFKIILLLVPISLYLIAQYFLMMNQLSQFKKRKIYFHNHLKQIRIISNDGRETMLRLTEDIQKVREVKSVQKNNGLLFGYYELSTASNRYYLPFVLAENLQNKDLFNSLQIFPREIESKLFPII